MSMKENVNFVKDELNSEEKFLEGFVKVERFYKKFKSLILGVGGLVIVLAIAFSVNSYMEDENKIKANIAFDKIILNPNDKDALATLKETNKSLYNVALFLQAKEENKSADVQIKYLKELALYQKALEKKSITDLGNLSMENDFLLKEFAIFNKALLLANEGKFNEAKTALNLIPQSSKAYELSSLLKHYLLTK